MRNKKNDILKKICKSRVVIAFLSLLFVLATEYITSRGSNGILLFICYIIDIFYLIFGTVGMLLDTKINNNKVIKIICYIGWAIMICLFFKLILLKYM